MEGWMDGRRMKEAREGKRLTALALADACRATDPWGPECAGMRETDVYRYEAGRAVPGYGRKRAIEAVLGVSL
jgi:transcriptional regulator with XRE-family HTH domain